MHKVMLASLALSPMLLHAQTIPVAKAPAAPALVSSLVEPTSPDHATLSPSAPLRISTGVTPPRLITTADLNPDQKSAWLPIDRLVVVSMIVDRTGVPTDLSIARSGGPVLDRNILQAVKQYRFKPGTIDNQAIPVPLTLEVTVRKPIL